MKTKLLFLSLLVFIGFHTKAQVSLGVQGGAVMSNVSGKQTLFEISSKPKSKFSWQAGLMADIPLGESGFRFIPELKFVNKGFKAEEDILGVGTATGSVNLSYIELPVNFGYALDLGGAQLVLGAGPYAALGIIGKAKYEVNLSGTSQSTEEDIKFGSNQDELKPLDFGANLMAGLLLENGLMVKANYSLGLANASNIPNSTFKNTYMGLSLVYFFKRAGE